MRFEKRSVRLVAAVIPAFILGLLFAIAPASMAQLRSAVITGSVTDPSGAIVPDADIVVTETATSVSYPSKTNSAGLYTVPYLEAGDYTVTITKAGFEKFTINNLRLDSAQTVREDVKLTIGAQTVAVEVNAAAQQIDTEDGTLSGLTPAAVIDVIPNVTNNPFLYVTLQNGISGTASTSAFSIGTGGRSTMTSFGVDGAQSQENNVMIDGLPVMAGGNNDAAIIPNLEGIQSVQVLSNSYSAEYGHGAGIFSLTSKSGTNKFHGLASYEIRNEAFIANTSSAKATIAENGGVATSATRRQAFKVNNIGGEVDGPVIKDKLFFTSSFHYLKHNFGSSVSTSVPTALERTGDFGSSYVTGLTGQPVPLQLFNPFSVTTINSNLYQRAEYPTATGAQCTANPFGSFGCGDIITNPSPIGLAILSEYPLPNAVPTSAYDGSNYTTSLANTTSQYLLNNRGDYKRGRHSVYVTAGLQWDTINQPNTFGAGNKANFNDVGLITADRNYYAQIGDTVVFTPTLIMDVRYGFVRDRDMAQGGRTTGFTQYGAFGINAATQALMAYPTAAPNVTPGTWSNLTTYGQFDNKQEYQILHSGNGSVTKIKGNMTFKAGAQFQIILHNYTDLEEAAVNLGGCCASDQGQNSYTAEYITATGSEFNSTGGNLSAATEGTAGAQTLVNEGVWFVRPGANLKPAYASKYFAFYSQNDWKITHSLTLNLGVRYEIQPGISDRYNRMGGYDLSSPNPLFPNTLGAIAFPGTTNPVNGRIYGHGLWDTMWNNWTPHLGFAYRLRSNLVARGGFSTTYLPTNTGNFSSPNDYGEATWASGNTGSQTYGASPHGIPTEVITDAAPLIAATKANYLAPQTYGVNEAYFDRNFKNGVQNQYNFTLETTFGAKSQWSFSAGEVGTRQNHLFTRNLQFQNLQTISATAPGTLAAWRATRIANTNGSPDPAQVQATNPFQPASGPLQPYQNQLAGATLLAYIPYLQYPLLQGGGNGENGTHGFGSFDSLQVHFGHRSTALYLDANYTWSKTLGFVQSIVAGGNISSLDLLCNRCNRNYMSQDQPNRLIVTAVYQSPFSQGQRWEGADAVTRGVLGGWSLSPIFLFTDGSPITLSGGSGQFTARPNYAGTGKGSVPLRLPTSYRGLKSFGGNYDGKTKVTLPCGIIVTPGLNSKLEDNECAFSGPIVTNTVNGTTSTFADQYWYGNGNQTNGNLRGHSRVDVQLSLRRTFKLTERFKLDVTAAATNLMNSAEWSSSPGGGGGGTDVVNNPANGQIVGLLQGNTYGTWGNGTNPPREIEMVGRIVF